MMNEFNTAIKNTTALPLLGYFCGWNLCGGSVNQVHLDRLLEKHGLNEDFKMPHVGATTAYRRAVVEVTRAGKKAERLFETVKIEETEKFITHAIVKREVLEGVSTSRDSSGELVLAGDVNLEVEFRVGFDKERRNNKSCPVEDLVRFEETAVGHPMARAIMDKYADLVVVYKVDDLRFAFQNAFERWSAFRALSQGAMWFMPKQSENKMRAWEALLKDLGHKPLVIPVFDTADSKAQMRDLAQNTLDGQLREVKDQIAKYLAADTTRESTLEKRMVVLDELRAKANLYKSLLGMEIEALDEGVTAARESLIQGMADRN
jgi:hypothetical protein